MDIGDKSFYLGKKQKLEPNKDFLFVQLFP